MVYEYVIPCILSMFVTHILLNWWIRIAPILGFKGKDLNKPGEQYAVEATGIWVILSSVFGILAYIAIETYTDRRLDTIPLLSVSMTLLLAGLLGFFDDILGWKKGISPAKRVFLTIPISLPLIVVKAGTSIIELPLIGLLDLGLLYPLIVVPIGIIGASNAFNMIAGYNGLEAIQSMIILSSALILAYARSQYDAIAIVLPILVSILIFYLFYNKYPARAFPGNSFTYGIGALYASLAIYWNFEKYAVMTFTLYFIELALFIRGLLNKVYKENFGKVQSDGSLLPPYDKSYSLTHLAIKLVNKLRGKCYEQDVVRVIASLQLLVCIISLYLVIAG